MNYKDLDNETQLYLNRVMDVYAAIKDKFIKKNVKELFETKEYEFTKYDKKIISLFIAGFLIESNLKNILLQHDNIKLRDLLNFVNLRESDIKPLGNDKYEEFYKSNMLLDLMTIINEKYPSRTINKIKPEVIIRALRYIDLNGSDILEYYSRAYNITRGLSGFSGHPIFDAVENYTILEGYIVKEERENSNKQTQKTKFVRTSKLQNQEKSGETKVSENIWEKLDEIKAMFIGQEEAAEALFYNLVNNQILANNEDIPDDQRSLIFLNGSTGTGKTAITRAITKELGVPFSSSSVTNYSSTGYVGDNLTDILKDLYKKANGDLEIAERGIVVLDEFDKIAYSRLGGLEMKKAVQQQLLDFLSGGKYKVSIGESIFDNRVIEFDTSKLTFVCLGALTDLHKRKTAIKQADGTYYIGDDHHITPQDLMGIGLEKELVGRFNTFIHTNDYSISALEKILRESTISPSLGFQKWIESQGKKLVVDDDGIYNIIAEQAYNLNTGARGLQTIMNSIRTMYIRDVLCGPEKNIHLNFKSLNMIYSRTYHEIESNESDNKTYIKTKNYN